MRSDGRQVEADLVQLADQLAEKEKELRTEIETKVQNHRRWNQNHIDLTVDPLSPVQEQGLELKFRPAKTQYLMTPPASVSSDSMEVDEVGPEHMQLDKPQVGTVFQFKAGGLASEPLQTNQPAFRRRIGRLSRLWIDRRGMAMPRKTDSQGYSDRWKYDSDDEEDVESPVYELDPYDTRALKFRATIPLSSYLFRGRPPVQPEPNGANRTLPAPPAAAPQQAQAAS